MCCFASSAQLKTRYTTGARHERKEAWKILLGIRFIIRVLMLAWPTDLSSRLDKYSAFDRRGLLYWRGPRYCCSL